MKGDSYDLENLSGNAIFRFTSTGPKGIFNKVILFEQMVNETFNLALCLERDGMLHDDITTNNQDFTKTMFTVAKALELFFETHTQANVQIGAADEKRLKVYNGIFKRKHAELEQLYEIYGLKGGLREPYNSNKHYDTFELSLRKS